MGDELSGEDLTRLRDFCEGRPMALAIVRTREAPSALDAMFSGVAGACGLRFCRNLSSPASDFGFAEFNSNDRILVLLYIGGDRTELVSLADIDMVFLNDLEETISSSNIQSSSIRDGL